MSAAIAEAYMGDGVAQLESRVAKVEAGVEYIGSRVSNIEIDLRDMRKSMDQRFDGVSAEFKAIRAEMREEFRALRAEFKQESDRVTRLQLITVIMGIEVLLVTRGSQMFQAFWEWLSRFK